MKTTVMLMAIMLAVTASTSYCDNFSGELSTVIPEFAVTNCPFDKTLLLLQEAWRTHSSSTNVPILALAADDPFGGPGITMSLRNIPVGRVLEYLS